MKGYSHPQYIPNGIPPYGLTEAEKQVRQEIKKRGKSRKLPPKTYRLQRILSGDGGD